MSSVMKVLRNDVVILINFKVLVACRNNPSITVKRIDCFLSWVIENKIERSFAFTDEKFLQIPGTIFFASSHFNVRADIRSAIPRIIYRFNGLY